MNKDEFIPEPTLRRLSSYLLYLLQLREKKILTVSSTLIATELFIESGKVRKDFQYAKIKGRPKRGYDVNHLIVEIDRILKWDGPKPALIVGVGSLGTALLGYSTFQRYGIRFVAAFDNDPAKIGQEVQDLVITNLDSIKKVIKSKAIEIAVLTVPEDAAQEITDILVKCKIKAIWNFAPVRIKVPTKVIVEQARFAQSLAVLTYKIG
jgi:redox-sensing transcriptional repressor